jgi:hypothetical protein
VALDLGIELLHAYFHNGKVSSSMCLFLCIICAPRNMIRPKGSGPRDHARFQTELAWSFSGVGLRLGPVCDCRLSNRRNQIRESCPVVSLSSYLQPGTHVPTPSLYPDDLRFQLSSRVLALVLHHPVLQFPVIMLPPAFRVNPVTPSMVKHRAHLAGVSARRDRVRTVLQPAVHVVLGPVVGHVAPEYDPGWKICPRLVKTEHQ